MDIIERLFTHELVDHDGKPNGVHLGCSDRRSAEVCAADLGTAVLEWVPAAEIARLRADLARAEARLQWIAERYDGERLLDFDDVPDPYWGPRLAKEAIDRIDAAIAAQGADHE